MSIADAAAKRQHCAYMRYAAPSLTHKITAFELNIVNRLISCSTTIESVNAIPPSIDFYFSSSALF